MSPAPALRRLAEAPIADLFDQRVHSRYPIMLELQYRMLKGGRVEHAGAGRTVNISSGGILFEANDLADHNGTIELVMNWPFLLDRVCNLKLIVRGHIVRRDGRRVAVKAEQHEFLTAGVVSQMARPTADRGASQV